jgi:hypothetical protein
MKLTKKVSKKVSPQILGDCRKDMKNSMILNNKKNNNWQFKTRLQQGIRIVPAHMFLLGYISKKKSCTTTKTW